MKPCTVSTKINPKGDFLANYVYSMQSHDSYSLRKIELLGNFIEGMRHGRHNPFVKHSLSYTRSLGPFSPNKSINFRMCPQVYMGVQIRIWADR